MFTRRVFLISSLAVSAGFQRSYAQAVPGWPQKLLTAARKQIGLTLGYDPSYATLDYPGGDVPRSSGVCTDVIIRAYRDAFQIDLQELVHEDMTASFASYPKIWRLTKPDRNIDHRRVPNLERWFERQSYERAMPGRREDWQAGDLVTMRLDGKLPHIAIFSGYSRTSGKALYIHNIGAGTREEEIRTDYDHPKRFRFTPKI